MTLRDKLHDSLDDFIDTLDKMDEKDQLDDFDEHADYLKDLNVQLNIQQDLSDNDKRNQYKIKGVQFKNLLTIHF